MNRIAPLALLLALFLAGCVSISEKDRELALVHRNLAAQSLQAGDPRAALAEIEKSLERNPEDPEARNLYGLLLHLYFHRLNAAVAQYRQAIDLRPDYSEAKVNLGAAYTALGQCEKAIPLLEEARADLRYREPYLAENNLGWCKYELGDVEGAIVHLRAAIASNPGFCLGYRNLAQIAKDRGISTRRSGTSSCTEASVPTLQTPTIDAPSSSSSGGRRRLRAMRSGPAPRRRRGASSAISASDKRS